jgi:hypothetical protein
VEGSRPNSGGLVTSSTCGTYDVDHMTVQMYLLIAGVVMRSPQFGGVPTRRWTCSSKAAVLEGLHLASGAGQGAQAEQSIIDDLERQ